MLTLPRELARRLDGSGRDLDILVVRLGAMGDILRTVPPVRLVRQALPECRIVWVCDDRWTRVLEGHPDLDAILPLPRKRLASSSLLGRIDTLLGFRRRLRERPFDLVLDFHGNLRSGWVGRWSRAPVRVGYDGHQQKEGNRWFTTHRVPSGVRRTPRMQRNLDLIGGLGIPTAPLPDGNLPLVAEGRNGAARCLDELGWAGRYAVISPAASAAQSYKIPPARLFAAAARTLSELGYRVLVVWGPGEKAFAEQVVREAPDAATVAPDTDLPTLAALIAGATMYVGADSGPLHLACAVGTPVVAIYAPTDPVVNQPWGVPFRTVSPPEATYSGIKREDRTIGFEAVTSSHVTAAIVGLMTDLG